MTESRPYTHNWRFPPDYETLSSNILDTALREVELYESWRPLDPGTLHHVDVRFSVMPALTKKDIREHFPNVLPPGRDIAKGLACGEIQLVETSGTTDDKITNIWNQEWWDASERASWKLNSHLSVCATGDHREAILVNPKNVGIASDAADLPMDARRLSRFLYLNEKTDPLSWSDGLLRRMIAELNAYRPAVLEANPSMLARLSRFVYDTGLDVYQPSAIVFTYEYPTRFHHQQIGRVFSAPMISSYGTTEAGYVFMQCEEGKFHQNSEFCRVDYQPFKPAYGGPFLGRILVTPFRNPWSCLVRFNTGDLVRLEESGRCRCGRDTGMVLSSIQGRTVNLTLTLDGRPVALGELDGLVSQLEGVEEYKLVQVKHSAYEMHVAGPKAYDKKLEKDAREILTDLYGRDATVDVIFKAAIAPEMSGKYLAARALFSIDSDSYLDDRQVLAGD
jgi:phenylacetate-coenzyme A ligase PaaK-like adenylate-forming protein